MRHGRLLECATLAAAIAVATIPHAHAQEVDPTLLRAALDRAADREPSVDDVVEAALAELGSDPSRARDLATRARLSGLLPDVRIGVRRGLGWDLSELYTTDADRVQVVTGDELALYGEARFDLDRLVFSVREVPLLREERALAQARDRIAETVIRVYFERRRLMLERELLGRIDVARAVRIAEATALLDAFTRGAFRRMIAARRSPTRAASGAR